MKSAAYVRVHLVLAFLGLYIAGMLSMSHLLGVELPCGVGSGCDIVAQDPRSKLLGIPFAFYGLAGYGLIALIAVARLLAPGPADRRLSAVSYVLTTIGLLASIGLTIFSVRSIHAVCTWCIASACTMSLLFASHAFAAFQGYPDEDRRPSNADSLLFVFSFLTLTVVLALSANRFKQMANTVEVDRTELAGIADDVLCPTTAHRTGPKGAKFAVVFFGDLTCPVCEEGFKQLSKLMDSRHDFQLVFRHLPLYFHPQAHPAAELSEMAAEKGKFWEFTRAMYDQEPDNTGGLVRLAESLGVTDAQKRLSDRADPAYKRVESDLKVATKLGLHSTPSIFVLADGYFPEPASYSSVATLLDNVESDLRNEAKPSKPKKPKTPKEQAAIST